VGSYIAYKLAEKGHKIAVLERKGRLGEQVCCTGIIGQECVSSFDIEDDVILGQFNSARLFSPSGRCLRLQRQKIQAFIIDRPKFDLALAEKARSQMAEYILNSLVQDIEVDGNKVRVTALWQGKKRSFEARAAVVASGFSPGLVKRLGLGRISDFVTGAQAEVKTNGLNEVEVYFGRKVAPGFFAWLAPTLPNRALVGLLSRHNPGYYLKKFMSSLLSEGKITSAEVKLTYDVIPLKPLPRTYGDRLLIVGDAAGQVKPTTGGGIYYGLLCADIAANTLHQALESDALSAMSLSSYEREWKQRLGRELKIGYWTRKLYERLNDGQVDKLFDIMQSNSIAEALLKEEKLSFDWHGEAILRVLAHSAISKALGVMRLPFRLTKNR